MAKPPRLQKVEDEGTNLMFTKPSKKIHDGPDVTFFLKSLAYRDIMTFVLQLNRAVLPRKVKLNEQTIVQSWPLNSKDLEISLPVKQIMDLLTRLEAMIDEAPPDTGPRRFGNVSFRKWHKLVEERIPGLLRERLSSKVAAASEELEAYLLGSFGSPQRLDYGTGHELSFLAFLGCLWKLSFFEEKDLGIEERGIVLGVFQQYLQLVRHIIKIYTLEPAGSHGVWGLDDNSFLPYVFGSAQLCPAIAEGDETPTEGSLPDAPEPSTVTKQNLVEKEKDRNMYFSTVAFIYDVKKGPFWEHSPMLFDISGIKDGWGKINKGMIKMYHGEVLSKFPVVQHFPFGSLFRWERDPDAKDPPPSTHTSNQPLRNPMQSQAPISTRPGANSNMLPPTAAPWRSSAPPRAPTGMVNGVTRAPWATQSSTPLPVRRTPHQRAPPPQMPAVSERQPSESET